MSLEHLSGSAQETVGYATLRCGTWIGKRGLGVSTTCMVSQVLGTHEPLVIEWEREEEP